MCTKINETAGPVEGLEKSHEAEAFKRNGAAYWHDLAGVAQPVPGQ